MLRQQLVKRVWAMFRSEGSDLYQAGLVDIIGSTNEGEDEEKTRVKRKKKSDNETKPAAKRKKKD
eukprot:12921048-Alexandrium_andersonii.AAC.1